MNLLLRYQILLIFIFLIIGLASASLASAATAIYRSVGPSATAALASNTSPASSTVSVSSGTATFSAALPDNIGVGDALIIDTNDSGTITSADTLLFIHGRTDSTHYIVKTHTGATPADISNNDVYQIYRAYISLTNAENGVKNTSIPMTFNGGNRSLTANDEVWNIACYANGTVADTAAVYADGWTTDTTRYLRVYTPVSSEEVGVSQRHFGKWDENKYKMVFNGTSTNNAYMFFTSTISYVKLEGIQAHLNGYETGGDGLSFAFGFGGSTAGEFTVANNIIKATPTTGSGKAVQANSTNRRYRIYNNIFYGWRGGSSSAGVWSSDSDTKVYNNTAIDSDAGFLVTSNNNPVAKNNITQNCTDGFLGLFNAASDYNISDISSDAPSPSYRSGLATEITFINENNKDFHLSQSDTFARGTGANLTADASMPFSIDIDEQLRNSAGAGWDIGADEGTAEFAASVMQSGGDYSTLSSWETGVQTDLVADTTRVFNHGGITGAIADNASVTGVTSGATATVVHAASTQILLENITGTFVSGETIQVTAGNSVVISDNGNPASAAAKIDGAWTIADTTAVSIDGWNTGADNYIKIYTIGLARHTGKWDGGKYRIEKSGGGSCLISYENNIKIDGLQVKIADANLGYGLRINDLTGSYTNYIANNIIVGSNNGMGVLIDNSATETSYNIYNNVIYNWGSETESYGILADNHAGNPTLNVYNNTVLNSGRGISSQDGNNGRYVNNISINNGNGDFYLGTGFDYANNNISLDSTAPGSGSKVNAQVKFISTATGSEDFHLASDDKFARDFGADLSADSGFAFNVDMDSQPRSGSWDVGADESINKIYRSVGPSATGILDSDSGHTKSLTELKNGVATFSSNLPDNVGVGDVVIIDTSNNEAINSTDTLLFIHRRNSPTSYNLRTHTGAVPVNITSNDTYAIYRAYTSLSNAESGTINSALSGLSFAAFNGGNRDLVANNEQWNITCYANGATADTTAVNIDGWVTDEQNFIKVYTPVYTNEVGVAQRHDGKWDNNKYQIVVGEGPNQAIYSPTRHIVLDGLQIRRTGVTSTFFRGIQIGGGAIISNSIIAADSNVGLNSSGILVDADSDSSYIFNNVIYGYDENAQDSGISIGGEYKVYVYNNTVTNCLTGITDFSTEDPVLKNNISYNNTDNYDCTCEISSTNNLSGPTQADAPGLNPINNATILFLDEVNKDFRLSSDDTVAKGAGLNLSADANLSFSDDIRGQSRPASPDVWSVGACEVLEHQKVRMEGAQIKMEGSVKME